MATQNQGRLISLPLERIHAATCANANDPIDWILYPQRDNLFCVFDSAELSIDRSEHRLLKIVNGVLVMEELDLDLLVQNASTKGRGTSTHQVQGLDADISALARSPHIAIRYQKTPGQVRRFQMRFTSDADYQTAVSVLIQVRFPVRFVGPPQAAVASVPKAQALARKSWGSQNMTQPAHRDTTPHQDLLQRPSTSGNALQRAIPWDHTRTPASVSTNIGHVENASRDPSQPRRCQTSYQPVPPDMNSDTRIPQTSTEDFRMDSLWTSSSPMIAPTPPELHTNHLPSHHVMSLLAPSRAETYSSHQEVFAPFRFSTTIPETPPPTTLLQTNSQQMSPLEFPHGTPISTPDLRQTMSQIMPPRRELPFAKPGRSEKPKLPQAEVEGRSCLPTLELPELPKPTLRPVSKGAATLRKASQGDGHPEVKPSGKLSSLLKHREGPSSTPPAIPPSDGSQSMAFSTPSSGVGRCEVPPKSRLPEGPREPQEPKDKAVSSSVHIAEAASVPKHPFPQGPLQDEDLRYMDAFVQKHMRYEQSGSLDDLSRLAALSNEDRQAEIDTMMCDLIYDENFYKLLEAVENSWQRIGFDLHR